MNEKESGDQGKFSVLNAIVDLVASNDNIIDIYREISEYIKTILPCDSVTILLNNEQSRHFSIIPVLNADVQNEIVIYYHETSITEILRGRRPIYRADLSQRGLLTPGDLKFLSDDVRSSLAVPILHENRVRAVLNLSSREPDAFKTYHQEIVDEIAILLSLSMERVYLFGELNSLKDDVKIWKQRYKKLLACSTSAIAVVSNDLQLIYEVNGHFEELAGYTADQLHGMNYDQLHPKVQHHVFSQVIEDTGKGKIYNLDDILLKRSDGADVPVRVCFISLSNSSEPLTLAIYGQVAEKPEATRREGTASYAGFHIAEDVLISNDPEKIAAGFLDPLGKAAGAKYAVLHLFDETSAELKFILARKFPVHDDHPLLSGLNEGPYPLAFEKGEVTVFRDVLTDTDFYQWLPIAQKLDYRSLICLPLFARGSAIGLMSLYYPQEMHTDEGKLYPLKQASHQLAMLLDNHLLHQQCMRVKGQNALLGELPASMSAVSEIEDMLRIAAMGIRKVMDFDYWAITLFDDTPDCYQTFTIASKTFASLSDGGKWEAFEDSALGWLKTIRPNELTNGKENQLQSTMSAMLFARNTYVGTMTLASLTPHVYSPQVRTFFEQITALLASVIQNHHLMKNHSAVVQELTLFRDFCQSLRESTALEPSLIRVLRVVGDLTRADLCTIRLIENGKPTGRPLSTIPDAEGEGLLDREKHEFIPRILRERKSLSCQESIMKYVSYLGVPAMVGEEITAVISCYWEQPHVSADRENDFLVIIADVAARVVENVRLVKSSADKAKDLDRVVQELERFIDTVSHTLKPPLVSIQGLASIMLNDAQSFLNQDAHQYLRRIQTNADQMDELIGDLLALSRAGHDSGHHEDVNIKDLVVKAASELIYHLEMRRIKLIIPDKMPVVSCDRKMMSAVFKNLIAHAIQSIGSSNPSPQIEIGCQEDGDQYRFSVKDNGIGIPREYQQRVFDLFEDIHAMTHVEEHGSGVGLATVKRIIESHNGKIWVESLPEHGSIFYFTLPREDAAGSR